MLRIRETNVIFAEISILSEIVPFMNVNNRGTFKQIWKYVFHASALLWKFSCIWKFNFSEKKGSIDK